MAKKLRIIAIGLGALLVVFAIVWLIVNPPGKFGYCRFGSTIYSCWPYSDSDIQVRHGGAVRKVEKTHQLKYEDIEWLLEDTPKTLIIATGWTGAVEPDEKIKKINQCALKILKDEEAIKLYNKLKKSGKKVAIHYHSTC